MNEPDVRQLQQALMASQQQLDESEKRFRDIVEMNRDAMIVLDQENHVIYVNQSAVELTGDECGNIFSHRIPLAMVKDVDTEIVISNKLSDNVPVEARRRPIQWSGRAGYLVTLRDISERKNDHNELAAYAKNLTTKTLQLCEANNALKEQQQAMEASKLQLEVLLNSAGEGVLGVTLDGYIHFANPKACKILGSSDEVLLNRKIQSLFVLKDEDIDRLNALAESSELPAEDLIDTWELDHITRLLDPDDDQEEHHGYWITDIGERIYIEFSCKPTINAKDECVGAVIMFQNISERKQLEEQLLHLANNDSLTGLSNRAHFHATLVPAIERQKRSDKTLAVLYLDMDHFKYINDTFGHDAGDSVLVTAAETLRKSVRKGDLIARLGGDEFALVLYDLADEHDAAIVAEKIIHTLKRPISIKTWHVNISFSIGIALLSDDLRTESDLIKAADTAMYVAKSEGRNNYKVYLPTMQAETEQKHRIHIMLKRAIAENEFSLVYQPKVSLTTKKMIGCEALLRWHPKNAKEVSPTLFIPNAEESGLMGEIGAWVLDSACRQVSEWMLLPDYKGLVVSINVSARQLGKGQFVAQVAGALDKYQIPGEAIEIEITETSVMENIDKVIDELEQIHALNVKIAIDDFGTGSSSLELLRRLPLDVLKIDRSFIRDIGKDEQDEEIINVILAVAKTLGLEVVAEGVETLEQLNFLSQGHCEIMQGYYFGKPVPPKLFAELIPQGRNAFMEHFSCYQKSDLVTQKAPRLHRIHGNTNAENSIHILVCEDDLITGYVIQRQLETHGFLVDIALNAKEGVAMLSKKAYRALTLDLGFGGLEGLGFLEQVQQLHPNHSLHVVVIASNLDDHDYQSSYQSTAIGGWLSKPVDGQELAEKFHQLIVEGGNVISTSETTTEVAKKASTS
ncbi:MAG: hypothetical protein COA42_09080 [Alteromonadaceae bacterium]|nr:MAG: hypothetical protein COA42_09080 [Alteromonadaceae bacterium]